MLERLCVPMVHASFTAAATALAVAMVAGCGPPEDPPAEDPRTSKLEQRLANRNWLAEPPEEGEEVGVRIRHGAPIVDARVERVADSAFELELFLPQAAVTPGQSAVLYRNDVVVGGGVIR